MMANQFEFFVSNIRYVYNKSFDPDKKVITYLFPYYTVALCVEGEGLYTIDNKHYTFKKGDCLFFPKNTLRSFCNAKGQNWCYITVGFDILPLNQSEDFIFNAIESFYPDAPIELQKSFYKLYNQWTSNSLTYKFVCRTLIQEILYRMAELSEHKKIQSKHYKVIEKARICIQNNIKEDIDIQQIIADSCLSPAHFRRLFKQIIGYSPMDYYNYVKIMQSKDLLEDGSYTVSEVAEEMGYSSVYYFSEVFKKFFNISPNNYIKRKKGV